MNPDSNQLRNGAIFSLLAWGAHIPRRSTRLLYSPIFRSVQCFARRHLLALLAPAPPIHCLPASAPVGQVILH